MLYVLCSCVTHALTFSLTEVPVNEWFLPLVNESENKTIQNFTDGKNEIDVKFNQYKMP